MVSRKRAREEAEENDARPSPEEPGLLEQLRNMWEFANLMQFIYSFGKVVKIDDDFDIEVHSAILWYFRNGFPSIWSPGDALLKYEAGGIGAT